MPRAFRVIKLTFLLTGILLLLAVPAAGLVSAALHWQGFCENAPGAVSPCSWGQYALREMFWGIFFFIPYFFLAALAWLGMSLAQFIHAAAQNRRRKTQSRR